MALAPQLSAVFANFQAQAPPPVQEALGAATKDFSASFDPSAAIKPGNPFPSFTLTNALGEAVTSASLLAQGPLLINFYRGEWCPFCNLALRALQQHLSAYTAKGVTLVAISPELPNNSLSTTEKHALKFPVLSDEGNALARQLGIVFQQPDSLRPIFDKFGNDLKARNGDDSFALPIPATILVDAGGVVRNVFVEPDYKKRLEPATALEWIDEMQAEEEKK
ncbi:hypothetical protein MMC20_006793 [Loxospora ochrophaea]|nr:hypothetical protein [Loxospora ochrophaea]